MLQELVKYEGVPSPQDTMLRALASKEETEETSFNITGKEDKIRLRVFVSKDGVTVKINGKEVSVTLNKELNKKV